MAESTVFFIIDDIWARKNRWKWRSWRELTKTLFLLLPPTPSHLSLLSLLPVMGLVGDQTVFILDKVSLWISKLQCRFWGQDWCLGLTLDVLFSPCYRPFLLQVEGNFHNSFDNGNTPVWGSFLNLADNTWVYTTISFLSRLPLLIPPPFLSLLLLFLL